MQYISTRGRAAPASAAQALLQGQAEDGGLYVPAVFPSLEGGVARLAGLDFEAVMHLVLSLFFAELGDDALRQAASRCVNALGRPAPISLRRCGGNLILDLTRGPTLAFKDVALSTLPSLMESAARQTGLQERLLILAATSGDTGSAAMQGFAGSSLARVLTFHPATGISEVQWRQMACLEADNCRSVGIHGNFDDAQRAVKLALADKELAATLLAQGWRLSSANSINIGRLVPQIAYYAWTCAQLHAQGGLFHDQGLEFVIPTGNFGNILAAWWARRLGLPITRFVCASNANNVLTDFIHSGCYDTHRPFTVSNSPSMDILVSSNLERLLFELVGPDAVRSLMQDLRTTGRYQLTPAALSQLQQHFSAGWVDEAQTLTAMLQTWNSQGQIIDPHTAVAAVVAERLGQPQGPRVLAETASPWKFPRTCLQALDLDFPATATDFDAARLLASYTGLELPPIIQRLEGAAVRHSRQCQTAQIPAEILAFINND